MKEKFSFFESYYESFKELPPEIVGQVILAMGAYYFDGEDRDLSGLAKATFALIKPVLEKSVKYAENGQKGGETPKANAKQTRSKREAKSKQIESKTEANVKRNGSEIEANVKQTLSELEANAKQTRSKNEICSVDNGIRNMDKDMDMDNITPLNPPKGKRTAQQIIEEADLDPTLEAAVKKWVKYKTERREAYKETGLQSLLTLIKNRANDYGINAVIACMNESMGAGYMGIVWEKLKRGAPPGSSGQQNGSWAERWANA